MVLVYSSDLKYKIWQDNPVYRRPSQYKPKGWTDSIEGYIHEARKLTTLILRNRKLAGEPYTWFGTIVVEAVLPPKDVAALWTRAARSMREAGIVALWVREPSKQNKVHYHLLLRSRHTEAKLRDIVKAAMPQKQVGQKRAGWHMNLKPVTDDEWWLAHYITKAKIAGRLNGRPVSDLYAKKRLLFVSGLPFNKVGEIGAFWVKPKTKMWDDVKATEKKIAEGLEMPNVGRLAEYVHEFLGGYVPLEKIRRSFGSQADGVAVNTWIEGLLAGEWAEVDGA